MSMDLKRSTQIDMGLLLKDRQPPRKSTTLTTATSPTASHTVGKPDRLSQPGLKTINKTIAPSTQTTLDVTWGSPWDSYDKCYDIRDLGGPATVAIRRFTIKEFPSQDAEGILVMLRRLRHVNLVGFQHAYITNVSLHVILEDTLFSLRHILVCPVFLDGTQLSSLLGQVRCMTCFLGLANPC